MFKTRYFLYNYTWRNNRWPPAATVRCFQINFDSILSSLFSMIRKQLLSKRSKNISSLLSTYFALEFPSYDSNLMLSVKISLARICLKWLSLHSFVEIGIIYTSKDHGHWLSGRIALKFNCITCDYGIICIFSCYNHIFNFESGHTLIFLVVVPKMHSAPTAPAICVQENWRLSFDRQGWSTCPDSTPLIIGLERSKAPHHERDYIYHIEAARCCSATAGGQYDCLVKNWTGTITRYESNSIPNK